MITLAVKHTFYHCARRLIAKQAECTFALLRYPFGGDRPSQTAQQKLSSARLTGIAVRTKVNSGWYFNVGPSNTSVSPSMPPSYPTQNLPQPSICLQ